MRLDAVVRRDLGIERGGPAGRRARPGGVGFAAMVFLNADRRARHHLSPRPARLRGPPRRRAPRHHRRGLAGLADAARQGAGGGGAGGRPRGSARGRRRPAATRSRPRSWPRPGSRAAYALTDLEPDPARSHGEAGPLLERLAERIAEAWLRDDPRHDGRRSVDQPVRPRRPLPPYGAARGGAAGGGGGARRPDRGGRGVRRAGCSRRRARRARRRRAAARPGRQPRARQRAGPYRVGGVRHRDPRGGGRRRDHDRRHAAELPAADRHRRRAGGQAVRRRGTVLRSTSASGAARSPATWPTCAACTTRACTASSASSRRPASRSSPRWTRRGCGPR